MKKMKIALAAAAVVAMASPAMALTGDIKGFYMVQGYASNNVANVDEAAANNNNQLVDQRFRLQTTAAANDDLKFVMEIESDYTWGSTATAAENGGGALRADKTDEIELRAAYLDFNAMGANFKIGTQTYNLGNGFIVNEQGTGLQASFKGLQLAWVKKVEANYYDSNDEADYYQAQYDIKAGDFTISPLLGYLDEKADETETYYYGVLASGKAGDLSFGATLIGNDWENDAADTDGQGIAAQANARMKLGATSVGLAVAYYGDEDNAGGEFKAIDDVAAIHNFSEILTGGEFAQLTGNYGNASLSDAFYNTNFMYVKLDVSAGITDAAKVRGAYIYAEQAVDDNVNDIDAITYGHEVDAYFDYEIMKGLTSTTGGGYLIADDDMAASGDADDAWKLGTKLTYKF